MRRAAVGVDVPAVRLGCDQFELGAERTEDHRGGAVRCSVRAVERDPHAGQVELEGASELPDVVVEGALELPNATDPSSAAVVKTSLDRRLCVVVELDAAGV